MGSTFGKQLRDPRANSCCCPGHNDDFVPDQFHPPLLHTRADGIKSWLAIESRAVPVFCRTNREDFAELLMAIRVTRSDPRYALLHRSRNFRWDGDAADAHAEIELCETAEQAAEALQRAVHAGMRPTVRSGGHCYEDFVVNNPGGMLLDLSLLKSDALPGDGDRYRISPGQQLGEAYIDLYKRRGVTIPGGSCYNVGAGGHITGGGYGVLSRLHGLTVDWLSAVEILTVDNKGHVALNRFDEQHDPDLFRACRGGGGGNFGVVTGFLFDRLPTAPFEVVNAHISFDWRTMTEGNFVAIVQAFGDYFEKRGCEP